MRVSTRLLEVVWLECGSNEEIHFSRGLCWMYHQWIHRLSSYPWKYSTELHKSSFSVSQVGFILWCHWLHCSMNMYVRVCRDGLFVLECMHQNDPISTRICYNVIVCKQTFQKPSCTPNGMQMGMIIPSLPLTNRLEYGWLTTNQDSNDVTYGLVLLPVSVCLVFQ